MEENADRERRYRQFLELKREFDRADTANELLALDDLFTLPEGTTDDERLQRLYNVLTARMQREVAHLPVTTLHYMVIDRLAYNFILMKEKERNNRGYGTAPAQKAFNQFWLSLVQEFNKLVVQSDQKRQLETIELVRDIILSVLSTVRDENIQNELKGRFASAFDEAGIM